MDSVSQFVLGAAIGHLTLGKRLGRRAIVVGGVVGSLPDADVLVQYIDAVESFTYHRSFSHSLLVLTAISPFVAWLLQRLFSLGFARSWSEQIPSYQRWFLFTWLTLITHPLLDAFTLYGTQIWWPLPVKPVAIGSIFIIDLAYTLPILVGLWLAWRSEAKGNSRALKVGLFLSTAYLLLTVAVQQHVKSLSIRALQARSLPANNVLVAPTPFSLLWRMVSTESTLYHEGYYSVFDSSQDVRFATYDRGKPLFDIADAHWPVARLDWFTDGMVAAKNEAGRLVISDLRMGIEAQYVFRFDVGALHGEKFVGEKSLLMPLKIDRERSINIVKRVTDESVDMRP